MVDSRQRDSQTVTGSRTVADIQTDTPLSIPNRPLDYSLQFDGEAEPSLDDSWLCDAGCEFSRGHLTTSRLHHDGFVYGDVRN